MALEAAPAARKDWHWPAAYGVRRRRRTWDLQRHAARTALGRERYERLMFRRKVGFWPDYRAPRSLFEKISWRKVYQSLPTAVRLSDKVAVREYVAATVGARYLNEALLIAERIEDVDLSCLPARYAARGAHGSGINMFILDAAKVDPAAIRARLAANLRQRYGRLSNEWWYEQIPPRLLFEPLMWDDRHGFPLDYKVWVFHGRAKFVNVHPWRHRPGRPVWSIHELDWTPIASSETVEPIPRPAHLEELVEVAEALATGMDFIRVDLYAPNDERVVFGELTFAPGAGWDPFRPRELDLGLGAYWTLPGQSASPGR